MEGLTLKSDGTILLKGRPFAGDPLAFLNHQVQLEEGYSLRHFFRLFDVHDDLKRLSVFAPACLGRYREGPESGCTVDEFDCLELSKTVEMIGFPGRPALEIYMSFQGIRGKNAQELKFFPLERLLDMPVSLGLLKHIIFGDKVDVFEFETVYTLFEFIDGIAWALSFHNTPEQCGIGR